MVRQNFLKFFRVYGVRRAKFVREAAEFWGFLTFFRYFWRFWYIFGHSGTAEAKNGKIIENQRGTADFLVIYGGGLFTKKM